MSTHVSTALDAIPRGPGSGSDPRQEPLAIEGKRYLVREHLLPLMDLAVALAAARTFSWANAWLFGAVVLAIKLSTAIVLTRVNPGVLNARGTRRPLSRRDKLFFAVYLPVGLGTPVVAGLDAGGPGWSSVSATTVAIGLALMLAGSAIVIWALAVNAFFEPTVRLQRDRGHRTCTTGPYRIVRHPGYLGAIVATAGTPLVLGSWWALLPVGVLALAFVVRTAYEDRLLREELEGYAAFAKRVRFRLLPPIW